MATRTIQAIGVCAFATLGAASQTHAQIDNLQLLYSNDYRQTAINAYTNLGAQLQGVLFARSATNISQAYLVSPDDEEVDLNTFGGGFYSASYGNFSNQAALMAAFGSGNYVFHWSGGTLTPGNFAVNQPFANGIWPSVFPRFSTTTFSGLAGMDPSQPFTIVLANSFAAHPSAESVSGGMYISTVQASGLPGAIVHAQIASGASALTNTRVLPANTLQPSTDYFVTWLYANAIDDDPAAIGATRVEFRVTTRLRFTTGAPQAGCDSIDYNGDGLFPDDQDLIDFLVVLAGGACSTGTCNDIDFNNDQLFPDDTDLVAFLTVLAGGDC